MLEAIAGLVPEDGGRILWRGNTLALPRSRELMFYLPDRVRPWEYEYVERVIKFFAGAYGRPAKFTADASGTGEDYPGYPLVADAYLLWFFGACRC